MRKPALASFSALASPGGRANAEMHFVPKSDKKVSRKVNNSTAHSFPWKALRGRVESSQVSLCLWEPLAVGPRTIVP